MRDGVEHAIRQVMERAGFYLRRRNAQTDPELQIATIVHHLGIDLVLDVGANTGQYALALRRNGYSDRIVSFEPLSAAHRVLSARAKADRLWSVYPAVALGERSGEVQINVAANSFSSSLLPMTPRHGAAAAHSAYVGTETIPMETLDAAARDMVKSARAVWLKIDTQGYEKQVLAGAAEVLERSAAVQLEISLVPLYSGQALKDEMEALMRHSGFTLFALLPGFTDRSTGQTLQIDAVFVRT